MGDLARIREVEHALNEGKVKAMNGIVDLLQYMQRLKGGPDEAGLQALHALRRIFLALIAKGEVRAGAAGGSKKRRGVEEEAAERSGSKRRRVEEGAAVVEGEEAPAEEATKEEDPVQVYRSWVYEQYRTFLTLLLHTLAAPSLKAKVASLRTLMEFVRVESDVRGKPLPCFGHDLFFRVVSAIVDNDTDVKDEVVQVLKAEYLHYQDVRYCLLKSLKALAEKHKGGEANGGSSRGKAAQSILTLLMLVTLPESEDAMTDFWVPLDGGKKKAEEDMEMQGEDEERDDDDEEDDGFGDFGFGDEDDDEGLAELLAGGLGGDSKSTSTGEGASSDKSVKRPVVTQLSHHRKAFSDAWVASLKLDLTPSLYRSASAFIAKHVIDNMTNPLQLSDFLTASYEQGGLTSLLALEGLFVLMLHHNLEYPRFYASLYKLLSPQVLYARHRPKFFNLLRVCLLSPLVPAAVVAAFMKRLSRLALSAPPPAVLFILALCSNLLRRHPECEALVHRPPPLPQMDNYDATVDDPSEALKGGLHTSLWEVASLQRHYFPSAAAIARAIQAGAEDAKTPQMWDWDELAGYSYADLFGQEAKRRLKDPPLQHRKPAAPQQLFQPGDWFDGLIALPVGGQEEE